MVGMLEAMRGVMTFIHRLAQRGLCWCSRIGVTTEEASRSSGLRASAGRPLAVGLGRYLTPIMGLAILMVILRDHLLVDGVELLHVAGHLLGFLAVAQSFRWRPCRTCRVCPPDRGSHGRCSLLCEDNSAELYLVDGVRSGDVPVQVLHLSYVAPASLRRCFSELRVMA